MTRSLIERGEIWLATVDPAAADGQGGSRPHLVVSTADLNAWPIIVVMLVPITTRDRGFPHHVPVTSTGLARPSFAMPENVRSVSQQRLLRRLGTADEATLAAVDDWLRRIAGL